MTQKSNSTEAGSQGNSEPNVSELLEMARLYREMGNKRKANELYAQLVQALHPESIDSGTDPGNKSRRDH